MQTPKRNGLNMRIRTFNDIHNYPVSIYILSKNSCYKFREIVEMFYTSFKKKKIVFTIGASAIPSKIMATPSV